MHCRPTIVRSLPATRVARLCPQERRVRPGLRAVNRSRAGSNQDQKPVAYCLEDAYSSLESFAARMTQLTVPSLVLVFSERFKLLIPTITFSYCDFVDSGASTNLATRAAVTVIAPCQVLRACRHPQ